MTIPGLTIRAFQPGDALEIMRLFRDTVHNVNSRDYTPEQVEAWAPALMDEPRWHERLRANFTYVAEAGGQIVGFSELERGGRIATLYVHHRYQTQGIGSRLLSDMETRARALGARRLTAEASLTAYGFFQRRGFKLVRAQDVDLRGVSFRNFIMERVL
ncbi:MAG TPA: GNAT family N-acetyltransferase [Candidatus Acidoferrum sp.]|nr:GNAT family N-acetyltransferase [Candidatus Acidoferrum sp.]